MCWKGKAKLRLAGAIALGLLSAASGQENKASDPNLPTVLFAEKIVYPKLALLARIEGVVWLRIKTDGEKAVEVLTLEGPPMLARAAEATIKSWKFARHFGTEFESRFEYEYVTSDSCEEGSEPKQSAELDLPKSVRVAAVLCTSYVESRPPPGPRRIYLSECELNGKKVSCMNFDIAVAGEKAERFVEDEGRTGFIVPEWVLQNDAVELVISAGGRAFRAQIEIHFLKREWRLIISKKPFPREWRYLTDKWNFDCIGIIHFRWGEPETLMTANCEPLPKK